MSERGRNVGVGVLSRALLLTLVYGAALYCASGTLLYTVYMGVLRIRYHNQSWSCPVVDLSGRRECGLTSRGLPRRSSGHLPFLSLNI